MGIKYSWLFLRMGKGKRTGSFSSPEKNLFFQNPALCAPVQLLLKDAEGVSKDGWMKLHQKDAVSKGNGISWKTRQNEFLSLKPGDFIDCFLNFK